MQLVHANTHRPGPHVFSCPSPTTCNYGQTTNSGISRLHPPARHNVNLQLPRYLGMQTRHARYTAIRPCESSRQVRYSMEMTEKLRTRSAASLAGHPITVRRMESSKACTLSISPLGQLAHSSGSVDHQSTSLELWCINGRLQSKVRDGRDPSEATFPSPADIAF